jgi:hypothetical protein
MALIEINKNPSRRECRQFAGLWVPGFLLLVGVLVWYRSGSLKAVMVLATTGLLIAGLGLLSASFGRVLYLGWMYAAYPVGLTVSFLVMAIVYFVILTPVGLGMRLLGRRPLALGFDRVTNTYWTPRLPSTKIETYFRQF